MGGDCCREREAKHGEKEGQETVRGIIRFANDATSVTTLCRTKKVNQPPFSDYTLRVASASMTGWEQMVCLPLPTRVDRQKPIGNTMLVPILDLTAPAATHHFITFL